MRPTKGDRTQIAKRFGENLLVLRRTADISQEAAALRAGTTRAFFSLYENGIHEPKLDAVIRLSGAFGGNHRDLLGGMVWSPGFVAASEDSFRPEAWHYDLPTTKNRRG